MADNNGVGIKIGVEGERQFKKALSEINQSFRVLGSEMKLATSQFDRNESSVESLTAKNEVLAKQISAQKGKIETLRSALKNASDSFGENDRRTQQWVVALNNAEAELNGMERELKNNEQAIDNMGDESANAAKQTDKLGDEIDTVGKEADASGGKLDKLGSIVKGVGVAMGAALAAVGTAAVAAGKALVDMTTQGAAYADTVLTESTVTGIASDKLQEYMYAAELVDVSTETLTKSMAKNIKSMYSAADGSASYAEAYEKLGVSVTNADGSLRDSETVYWELIDALGKVQNETERDALAMTLLGKSAQVLNPLIEAGAEKMQELGDQAHDAGYVVSDEMLNAYGKLDDQIQYLNVGATAAKNALGTVLLPVLTELAGDGVSLLGDFTNGMLDANGDLTKMSDVIGEILPDALDKVMAYVPEIMGLVGSIVKSLGKAVINNLPQIVESGSQIVMSLMSGLITALPQITDGSLQLMLSLVNGILENLPMLIEAAIQAVATLGMGIGEALPELVPAIVGAVILICQTLMDNIGLILEAAFQIITGLAQGLLNALPVLINALPDIILSIISFVTDNIPKIIELGIQLTAQLAVGLVKAIPQLIAAIPQIIVAIIQGLGKAISSVVQVGKNIVRGLWQGIASLASWIASKVSSFFSGIVNGAKRLLGIRSPSKVFAGIGENMGAGIGVGFTDAMSGVEKDMRRAIPTDFDLDMQTAVTGMGNMSASAQSFNVTIPLTLDGITLTRIISQIQWSQNTVAVRNLGIA